MIAALYDIHGNLPALEAVLEDVRAAGVERIIVGGDVVPGPMPRECLNRLRTLDLPVQFLRGNGDRVVLEARAGQDIGREVPEAFREAIVWNAAELDHDTAAWMRTWPSTIRHSVADLGEILFCHATPQNDVDIFTRSTPAAELEPVFAGLDADLVVCGHTHIQFDRIVAGVRIVNAGSVGMSFQGVGAYWVLIANGVILQRTDYDLRSAAARVRATSYPQAEAFAENHVLATPTESAMMAAFAKASRLKGSD